MSSVSIPAANEAPLSAQEIPQSTKVQKYALIATGSMLTIAGTAAVVTLIIGATFLGSIAPLIIAALGLTLGPILIGYGSSLANGNTIQKHEEKPPTDTTTHLDGASGTAADAASPPDNRGEGLSKLIATNTMPEKSQYL